MSVGHALLRQLRRPGWICNECISNATSHVSTQGQRRSITRNHIRRIQIAEEEWTTRQQDIENGRRKSMLTILEERGYVNQIIGTRDELDNALTQRRLGVYAGVDPTAPSLHVGHMVPFMALGWLFIHGYAATFLMGGFTAGVGDPIGRLTGRASQNKKTRLANSVSMFHQLKRLSASMERYAARRGYEKEWAWRRSLIDNATWWRNVTMGQFMKVLGSGTRIGPMLGRDTVKNRLESGDGMSFSEFTYPLMQAWDWWELYKKDVQLQIGGADQFGNILAGAEAVKYLSKHDPDFVFKQTEASGLTDQHAILRKAATASKDPMGFTVPLLTTSSGEKFGKSAGNAIWLDPGMTSSFDLYQFFLRTADADVERYLKLFTFLPMEKIELAMEEQRKDESKRHAQHMLASEFVELVHGQGAAQTAADQHKQLFDKKLTVSGIQAQIEAAKQSAQSGPTTDDGRPIDINPLLNKNAKPLDMHTGGDVNITLPSSLVVQQPLGRILWSAGLVASRSEGQRMISNKGVYIGGERAKSNHVDLKPMSDTLSFVQATDPKWSAIAPFILEDRVLILRTGKWRVKVITIVSDEEYEASGKSCPGWKEEIPAADEESSSRDPTRGTVHELDLLGEEMLRQAEIDKQLVKARAQAKADRHERYRLRMAAEAEAKADTEAEFPDRHNQP